jgi:riboflavin biosynthesis pyrimidine reductase
MAPRIAANLIVGADGSTTLNNSSRGLSFPADREKFHQLRREFAALLIGGNTARNEPYTTTPLPLIVLSRRGLPPRLSTNPHAMVWDLPLAEAIARAVDKYGDLLIEAGPELLKEALDLGLINELHLTISEVTGGENPIDIGALTRTAKVVGEVQVDQGQFLTYRLAPSQY